MHTVKLQYLVPRGVALEINPRQAGIEEFAGRLARNRFVILRLEEEFMGRSYGIAKLAKTEYKAMREIKLGGIQQDEPVLDVTWWNRTRVDAHQYRATDQVQVVRASRLVPIKPVWGRIRQQRNRGGVVEGGTKCLQAAVDVRIVAWLSDNPEIQFTPVQACENDENDEDA